MSVWSFQAGTWLSKKRTQRRSWTRGSFKTPGTKRQCGLRIFCVRQNNCVYQRHRFSVSIIIFLNCLRGSAIIEDVKYYRIKRVTQYGIMSLSLREIWSTCLKHVLTMLSAIATWTLLKEDALKKKKKQRYEKLLYDMFNKFSDSFRWTNAARNSLEDLLAFPSRCNLRERCETMHRKKRRGRFGSHNVLCRRLQTKPCNIKSRDLLPDGKLSRDVHLLLPLQT